MADDSGRLNDVLAETSFLFGGNAEFVEGLQARWAADPSSVEPSWAAFFTTLSDSADSVTRLAEPPAWAPEDDDQPRPDWLSAIDGVWPAVSAKLEHRIVETAPAASPDEVRARTLDSLRAIMMIRAYRMRGHLKAKLDPLGLAITDGDATELDPASYGFRRERLRPFDLPRLCVGAGDRDGPRNSRALEANLLRRRRRAVHAHHQSLRRRLGCSAGSRAATRRSASPGKARSPSSRS